ncbi:MAG: hypothetical protein GX786_00185 [Clostridiales bacterium]|nr:hypothetical protein [Clostridiales bacterium]
MKKPNMIRWAPPGLNLKPEKQFFFIGMLCAVLYSFMFFIRYGNARFDLYIYSPASNTRILIPGAVMPDFYLLLEYYWAGLAVLAICMLALIIYHYVYHWQGSKSIYLMRRLPNRFELHRRCLTLPLIGIFTCLLTAIILLLLFYGTYVAFTPKECLTPDQWQKIWSVIL